MTEKEKQDFLSKWEGTLIHATLRAEDLGPAFLSALGTIAPEKAKVFKREWRSVVRRDFRPNKGENTGESDEAVNELQDLLSAEAPEGYYFGNTEGDGSDFGFWKQEEDPPLEEKVNTKLKATVEHLQSRITCERHDFALPGETRIGKSIKSQCRKCLVHLCRKKGWNEDKRVACNLAKGHDGPCHNTYAGV